MSDPLTELLEAVQAFDQEAQPELFTAENIRELRKLIQSMRDPETLALQRKWGFALLELERRKAKP